MGGIPVSPGTDRSAGTMGPALAAATQFEIRGDLLGVAPYGTGHINDTYCATVSQAGAPVRYILQRINHGIFRDVPGLMQNVARVTAHIGRSAAGMPDASRRGLTLVPARDGSAFHQDEAGGYWRMYLFIEKARTYDAITATTQAYEAARAFGRFQAALADLPGGRLHETIPRFHDTPARFEAFRTVLHADPHRRAAGARREVDFALAHEAVTRGLADLLARGDLRERVTHNDTKLNNVMLDDATGAGICVIDLDTVMPGLVLYDFGDMVRTATSPALEDERDVAKVTMRMPMFEALARGYLETAGAFLEPRETGLLAFAGKLITLEIGIRFLTDHLAGDTYFKTHREGHNLDRCRTQFRLVECIEAREDEMQGVVEALLARRR